MTTLQNTSSNESLPCFIVPMCTDPIIVPSVTVAEVIDYRPPEPLVGAPHWFMGTVDWRSLTLPVISFERYNHISESRQGTNSRIAIMNVVSNQHYMRFFSVMVQGIPKPVSVVAANLQKQDESMTDGVAMKVLLSGQIALIPDMDNIERAILTCHQWSKRFNIQASSSGTLEG